MTKFEGDLQLAMLELLKTAPTMSDYVLFPRVNRSLKDAVERACAAYVGGEDLKRLTFTYEGEPGKVLVTVVGPPEVMARLIAASGAPLVAPSTYINVDVKWPARIEFIIISGGQFYEV
jgi:hypothetical protein